jgi:carboxyl-terminal processing protease
MMRGLALALGLWLGVAPAHAGSDSLLILFDRTWERARSDIFDTTLVQQRLTPENRARLRDRAAACRTRDELAAVLNSFLGTLGLSHTGVFTPRDLEFSLLGTIGSSRIDRLPLLHIGAQYRETERGWVVRAVLEGYPAASAGLRRGDLILSAEGRPFHPVDSFASGRPVRLRVQRGARPSWIQVEPVYESMHDSFRRAIGRSARKLEIDGRRVGVVHLWVLTSRAALDQFTAVVLDSLAGCEGIILDLRDGFGGSWMEYLDLFFQSRQGYAEIRALRRDSDSVRTTTIEPLPPHRWFAGPLVAVINEGTRSGKEGIAFQLKKSRRAPLVGSTTAGAFIGASLDFLDPAFLLELPVTSLWLDGQVVEGVGVAPDSAVAYPLVSGVAHDPQMEAAAGVMRALLKGVRQ